MRTKWLWLFCLWLMLDGQWTTASAVTRLGSFSQMEYDKGVSEISSVVCAFPPTVEQGRYNGTYANFPNNTQFVGTIECNQGFQINPDPHSRVCFCYENGGACEELLSACLSMGKEGMADGDLTFLTVRGDPVVTIDGQTGIWSPATLVAFTNVMGWFSLGMYVGLLFVDQEHYRAPLVGIQALLWQFLYAALIASFGKARLADESCAIRRKIFNFIVGCFIGAMISYVEKRKSTRRALFAERQLKALNNNEPIPFPENDPSTSPPELPSPDSDLSALGSGTGGTDNTSSEPSTDSSDKKDSIAETDAMKPNRKDLEKRIKMLRTMEKRCMMALSFFILTTLALSAVMMTRFATCGNEK